MKDDNGGRRGLRLTLSPRAGLLAIAIGTNPADGGGMQLPQHALLPQADSQAVTA